MEDEKVDISLITIKNNNEVYENFKKSIEEQKKIKYELLTIDNCNNEYSSARKAYNEYINKAKGKYIIFIHQDIIFQDSYCLNGILNYANKIKKFGVIGVAGTPETLINRKRVIYSNIMHGENKENAGINITSSKEVQTVDECLFLLDKENINKIKFTEMDGWHLYAVEQCLRCKYEYGRKNYVIPVDLWHISDGKSLNSDYIKKLKIIIKKYKNDTEYINTTVKSWKTHGLISNIYINLYYIKQTIKKIVRR